jgi:hypothetical protein
MSAGIGRSKRSKNPTRVVKPASDDLKNNPGSVVAGLPLWRFHLLITQPAPLALRWRGSYLRREGVVASLAGSASRPTVPLSSRIHNWPDDLNSLSHREYEE